jgi:hypothetical protein
LALLSWGKTSNSNHHWNLLLLDLLMMMIVPMMSRIVLENYKRKIIILDFRII